MNAEQCSFIEVLELDRAQGSSSHFRATMGSKTRVVIGSGPTGGWTGAVLCEQEGCTWSFGPRVLLHSEEVELDGVSLDPEVEAVLAVTNLPTISQICHLIFPFVCFDLHALTPWFGGAGAGAEAWFFLSKSNARTISFSSATSDETAWVEEFVLTLATTALARV
ncbi:hypothetical protein Tco_0583150 [Tanacetum coccineum]